MSERHIDSYLLRETSTKSITFFKERKFIGGSQQISDRIAERIGQGQYWHQITSGLDKGAKSRVENVGGETRET